ncbi:MAG: DUF1826 domain-containing protein [Pseudomonadota bacterium]
MNLAGEVVDDAAVGVRVATTPRGLSAIQHQGCAAAIWQRQPLDSFQRWIDEQQPDRLPRSRIVLRPYAVHDAVSQLVVVSGLPACEERRMLVDDIAAQAAMFAAVMEAPYLRLRLDVITRNDCQELRIDAVTARLVCTYRGTGTQYGISTDGAELQQVVTVPTGSPIVLRGALWPETPKSGLRYRSPPIEAMGETRLVLSLDPVFDLEDRADRHLLH